MKVFVFLLAFLGIGLHAFAQTTTETGGESSPVVYVLIGIAVLGLIIYMLRKRQKRKFNE